jgi:hypothetical protein
MTAEAERTPFIHRILRAGLLDADHTAIVPAD